MLAPVVVLMRAVLVLAVVLALAGCGTDSPAGYTGSATVTVTITAPAVAAPRYSRDESALLAALAAESTVAPGLGDDTRIGLAEVTCAGLGAGLSVEETADSLREVGVAKPERFVTLAVDTMCPRLRP